MKDLGDNVHALEDAPKDDVAAVEPRGDDGADEELRSVRVLARAARYEQCTTTEGDLLGHGEVTGSGAEAVSSSSLGEGHHGLS